MPHAPLLMLDARASQAHRALDHVLAASREVGRALSGTPVVVSPHARRTGVYLSTHGGLGAFGVRGADVACGIEATVAEELAARWDRPILHDPLDHGVVVALRLLSPSRPIAAIGLAEDDPDPVFTAAGLAAAVDALEVDLTIVASVNTGVGVTARAPLTELAGALDLENDLRAGLERDVGSLSQLAPRLASQAGSCGLRPLLVLAHLFAATSMEVLAHEWPFGVGYMVARTRGAG